MYVVVWLCVVVWCVWWLCRCRCRCGCGCAVLWGCCVVLRVLIDVCWSKCCVQKIAQQENTKFKNQRLVTIKNMFRAFGEMSSHLW